MTGVTEKKLPQTNFLGFPWRCNGNREEGSDDWPALILAENTCNSILAGEPRSDLLSVVLKTRPPVS